MPERIKELIAKVLDWWNRYTAKQKTIIIAIAAAVIFTFAILIYVFTRPQYIVLKTCSNAKESSEIVEILASNNIDYTTDGNALTISVQEKDKSTATLALAAGGFVSDEFDPTKYINTSMSATASDKAKLWNSGQEKKMENMLSDFTNVKNAKVTLNIPEQKGTLLSEALEASAYIQLELDGTFTSANAQAMARAAATCLGNETTANITILDQDANLLFAGGDDYSTAGIANSLQELRNQAESYLANQVKRAVINTGQYNTCVVTSHLDMDFAEYEETVKLYYPNEGRDEGMFADKTTYESENSSTAVGVPGASSNDGTVMVTQDGSDTSSSSSETQIHYLPNESSTHTVNPAGSIRYESSSISVAMVKYRDYYEETAKEQGLLDGITWEEFKAQHGEDIKLDVDPDFAKYVANAAGLQDWDRISIVAYESPLFHDKEKLDIEWTNVLSVVMLLAILGLLAFVILRSMKVKEELPEEEELSVESLLQSTPEGELEDIDVESKSETRKMIEKFVDENPEAAAALLRNWLNSDWA